MAEPTIAETARLLMHMNGLGTVRRLDFLHGALCTAYEVGRLDQQRASNGQPEAESCLEG